MYKAYNDVFNADDLCIMSASPSGIQKLIDICAKNSLHNALTSNSTNSTIYSQHD